MFTSVFPIKLPEMLPDLLVGAGTLGIVGNDGTPKPALGAVEAGIKALRSAEAVNGGGAVLKSDDDVHIHGRRLIPSV